MRRRVLSFTVPVSTLLCAVALVLWMRSYSYTFRLKHQTARTWSGEHVAVTWNNDPPIMHFSLWKVESMPGFLYVVHRIGQAYPPNHLGMNPEDGDGLEIRSAKATPGDFLCATITKVIRDDRGWAGLGFGFSTASDRRFPQSQGYDVQRTLLIPFWPLVTLLAILPAAYATRRARHYLRICTGGCPSCGYNLTGNTSGTCPECGSAVAGKTAPGKAGA